jgi:hypothetical protein
MFADSQKLTRLCVFAVIGLLAGCSSPPVEKRPEVAYPVTYDVPVGNTQVKASTGPQDLNVSSTQQVTAEVGEALYYQILSPVPVTVSVYERTNANQARVLMREFQGTSFTDSIVPSSPNLEFVFAAQRANTGGTLKFTLSDRPLAPAIAP